MTSEETCKKQKGIKILPIIAFIIGILPYTACLISGILFVFCSNYVRAFLILLLIYQYLFAKQNDLYTKLLQWMKPQDYFNSYNLIVEGDLKNDHSIYSFHPHGVFGLGPMLGKILNKNFYESNFLGSRTMLNLPIAGIFAKWSGLKGVDNKSFKKLMHKGENISFIPGGFEEATLTDYGKDRVFIKNRKGFIKYALQHGYQVHPIYTFNENKAYNTITKYEKFRLNLNKFKIPGVLFYGKCFFLPDPEIDILTVVGKPITLPLIPKPVTADIDKYHQIYIDSLVELYNKYKNPKCNSRELEVL